MAIAYGSAAEISPAATSRSDLAAESRPDRVSAILASAALGAGLGSTFGVGWEPVLGGLLGLVGSVIVWRGPRVPSSRRLPLP
jgi:hypothetical protein